MKIGIDCRMWGTTTGRYIREVVPEIAKLDRENEYVLFFLDEDIDAVSLPSNFKKVRANILWHTFAEQFVLPFIFLKENLDLLHIPHFNIPVLYPKKFVVTIHDLTILRVNTGRASTHSYLFYQIKRLGFRLALMVAVWRSKKILTVTEYVKKDIVDTLNVPPEKIVVATNAVSLKFSKVSSNKVEDALRKYNIRMPYIFYVGNAHPHKNVESLLQAFERVSKEYPELQLVLAGKKYYFYDRLVDEWRDNPIFPKLNFTGFVDDGDLPSLYSGAELFVNPSKYEGFGLQLLEAFACEAIVVCSNSTSLPEVGGEAPYYFNPNSVSDISEKILQALREIKDDGIVKKRRELGLSRIKEFSWEDSAKKIHSIYLETKQK